MIEPTPKWQFTAARSLTQWYGRVQLHNHHVLGQWFCLDRETGKPLWERRFHRPNTIHGVSRDVIVASEMRSDGPWMYCFGCYGISLLTGKLLWTSHRSGIWGRLLRLCDFVPGFTNDVRDVPAHVVSDECICESGRVLDVRTGSLVRRIPQSDVDSHAPPPTEQQRLGETGYRIDAPRRIKIGPDAWLSRRLEGEPIGSIAGEFRLHRFRDNGSIAWSFDIADTGYHPQSSHYCPAAAGRPGFVYLTVSDEPTTRPDPKARNPHVVVPSPTRYHLLTLDLDSGTIIQDFPIGDVQSTECRIEGVDDDAVLISLDGRELQYHKRQW